MNVCMGYFYLCLNIAHRNYLMPEIVLDFSVTYMYHFRNLETRTRSIEAQKERRQRMKIKGYPSRRSPAFTVILLKS